MASEPVHIRSRKTDLRAQVIHADPGWQQRSLRVPEYEFSSWARRNNGNNQVREDRRVFYGNYKERGPYSD